MAGGGASGPSALLGYVLGRGRPGGNRCSESGGAGDIWVVLACPPYQFKTQKGVYNWFLGSTSGQGVQIGKWHHLGTLLAVHAGGVSYGTAACSAHPHI